MDASKDSGRPIASVPGKLRLGLRVLVAVIVLSVAVSAWIVLTKATFESVASKSFEAVLSNDGSRFRKLMSTDEQRAYGLDDQEWSDFFASYVEPSLSEWESVPGSKEEFLKDKDLYSQVHEFFSRDGRTAAMRVEVARTTDGLRTVSAVEHLINLLAVARYRGKDPVPENMRLFYALESLCNKDAEELRSHGLNGIYTANPPHIVTWEELSGKIHVAIARFESREEAGN